MRHSSSTIEAWAPYTMVLHDYTCQPVVSTHQVGMHTPCLVCKCHVEAPNSFFIISRASSFPKSCLYGHILTEKEWIYQKCAGDPVYMYSMGGLAEYCVVPANALAVIPETLPYSESAIIGCAVFTAYGAMKNAADMRAGETVAVIGTGGVGSRYEMFYSDCKASSLNFF